MSDSARTRNIREFFDGDSRQYTDERYPVVPRTCDHYSYLARRRHVLDMLDGSGAVRGRILDIGCGPAVYTRDLVERGWNVCGMDLSPGMLKAAAGVAASLPGGRVRLAAGQASDLPYREAMFDAVLCIGVVSYVEDVPKLLREVRRVLRPGGHAVFQISNIVSIAEIDLRVMAFLRRVIRAGRALDAHDQFLATVRLRAYRPARFDGWCEDARLEPRERRFFDFRPPRVIDSLAPRVSLSIGRALEGFGGSWVGVTVGAGYLVRVTREEQR